VTMARAIASARAILGEQSIRQRSFVAAHGSSTPQNRVTESRILDTLARIFALENWPVTAVKTFVGHSLAPASADQLINALGVFRYGILPGIETIDRIADDVHADRLRIESRPTEVGAGNLDVCFVNSKGFGGNNASAPVLSPQVVERMLARRYGEAAFAHYLDRRAAVVERAAQYDTDCLRSNPAAIYRFGESLIDEHAIGLTDRELRLPGFAQAVSLDPANPYTDMS
jgi:acetoacetyl-[acyl-carrier protein] synthase